MRNTILLILLMSVLFACSDDDNGGFDVEINEDMFSFTPTEAVQTFVFGCKTLP